MPNGEGNCHITIVVFDICLLIASQWISGSVYMYDKDYDFHSLAAFIR